MPAVIHINDNKLLIQHASGTGYSQGYAWFKNDEVLFDFDPDNTAIANCRLSPQQINNHYWQHCAQSSITSNGSGMRHAGDLIWRHLSVLKEQYNLNNIVFVVPSHYQEANLELLLGISKSCGLEVAGLVNKAVAILHEKVDQQGDYIHHDIQLHQTVSSVVKVDGGDCQLGRVDVLHEVGIHAMQDALLKMIQNRFIQTDRFDPLHYAQTEQQVFNQLNDLTSLINNGEKVTITVEHQGRVHSTSIDANNGARFYNLIYAN